ncbi:MAG: hypothetical protein E7C95_07805 [Anaerococcus prevotii]|uniref:hypothetical protein n=1 Tax=Anaerococcus prevotii TaxID=33034 RepID=UPI00290342EE|nr:hypothetical protein [Anaerococcus prevotii]MDU2558868.1 hypothetical protein [Anaerococcus prevotii]
MNKRKLGTAVLLLALGLGPIQTSQNYNFKLNNLAYAEDVASEEEITEEPQTPDSSPKANDSEGKKEDAEKDEVQSTKEGESSDDNLEIGDKNLNDPVTSDGEGADSKNEEGKTLEERRKDLLDKIDTYESELGKSNAIKLATDEEKEEHGKALEAFKNAIEKADEKELKSLEDDSEKEEIERNYYKAVSKLGYRVYSARDARTELKKQIDKANKLLEIKKDPGLKDILAKSLAVYDDFKSPAKTISEITEELKKAIEDVSTKENIAEEKFALSKEEEKKIDDMEGFPSTIFDQLYDKDVFDYKLEALVKIDMDRATDFTEENLEKVKERNIEAEKKYIDKREALLALIESDETATDKITNAEKAYDEAAAEAKSVVNDDKTNELLDRAVALKAADKDFRESENYKKLEKNKDIAIDEYVEAFKALDNASPEDSNYEKLIEDVEAAKKVIEEGKGKGNKEEIELQGKIDEALKADKHNEFINSENFRRATASYQNAYKDAYKALTDERTKENLDKLIEAKKAIDDEDFVKEFNDKADQLESYIDKAKSDKITEESLKKLKEEYKEKLQALRDNKDADTDDIKALEDEFNENLNPEKAEPGSNKDPKKTTKKVVTSSKKSNGKVRTGVDAILPVVGGVAVVAAIALIFTRKKNK